jgi:hypothetical protein
MEIEKLLSDQEVNGKLMPKNYEAWQATNDVYEMMVINLSSFINGLCKKPSGLAQLKNWIPLFKLKTREPRLEDFVHSEEGSDRARTRYDLARLKREFQVSRFKMLFPDREVGEKPKHEDIDALSERIYGVTRSVSDARHNFHAHRYESWRKIKVDLVAIEDAKRWFEYLRDIVNAIGLVALNESWSFRSADLDAHREFSTAQDLTDLILQGSVSTFCHRLGFEKEVDGHKRRYPQLRAAFYESEEWTNEQQSWPWVKQEDE